MGWGGVWALVGRLNSRRGSAGDAAEVPPGLRARGEATFVVRTAQGDDFMVRMAFDGKPLAPDHCCLEWPGDW